MELHSTAVASNPLEYCHQMLALQKDMTVSSVCPWNISNMSRLLLILLTPDFLYTISRGENPADVLLNSSYLSDLGDLQLTSNTLEKTQNNRITLWLLEVGKVTLLLPQVAMYPFIAQVGQVKAE